MRFPFEIIAVEETDNPAPIQGVVYVSHPVTNRGIPYARNLALKYAVGQVVVFIDDDCSVGEGWLDCLIEPFRDNGIVGVQGGVTVPAGSNAIGWAESILGFPGGGISRVFKAKGQNYATEEISTLNCVYRKWVIEKIGGFDENLIYGSEDYLLAKQACRYGRCIFVPNALVYHKARGNIMKIWSWFVRRGRAEIDLTRMGGWKRSDVFWLVKSSVLLKLLLLGIFCPIWPNAALVLFLGSWLLYPGLQYYRSFRVWKWAKLPRSVLFIIPMIKLTMDMATDCGRLYSLYRIMRKRGEVFPGNSRSSPAGERQRL